MPSPFQSEVKDLRKRLRTTEEDLKRSQSDASKLMTAVRAVHAQVSPHVEKERKQQQQQDEGNAAPAAAAVKKEEAVNGAAAAVKKEDEEVKAE